MPESPQATPFGINLYGHVSGDFGLAIAARNTLHALVENHVNVCVVEVDPHARRSGRDATFAALACDSPAGRFQVSLFHTNPASIRSFAVAAPARTWSPDRLRVIVPFWELPVVPAGEWSDVISSMDLVLAPTRFIAEAVARSCPGTPVLHYPQAVFLPEGVTPDRSRFGIPESVFVCLTVMDAGSGFERKNPMAGVEAFKEAFDGLGPEQVRLVVKLTARTDARAYAAQIEKLRSEADDDPRISVVEERMTYRDVLSLNASADVLLSLHRAEGLGLNLMEAMSLGTGVIATGWSGNMDFMTPHNSVIVGCTETDLRSAHPAYSPRVVGEGQYWAEPDVHDAAAGLRRLFENPEVLHAITEQARLDMDLARSTFMTAAWTETLRKMLAEGCMQSEQHATHTAAFRRLMRFPWVRRLRRRGGDMLRRALRRVERRRESAR